MGDTGPWRTWSCPRSGGSDSQSQRPLGGTTREIRSLRDPVTLCGRLPEPRFPHSFLVDRADAFAPRATLRRSRIRIGAAALSLIIFVLFLTAMARPWAFLALAVAGCAPILLHRPRCPSRRRSGPGRWAILYGTLYLLYALAPEIQSDALHYHLALAANTHTSGAFPQQISFYAVLPQGVETLFAFAFSIGGESSAKLLHLVCLAASLPLIHGIAIHFGLTPRVGYAAAAFYAVTPVVGISSTCAYTDAAIAFFTLAVFTLLLQTAPSHAAFAGLCAGGFAMPSNLRSVGRRGCFLHSRRATKAGLAGSLCAGVALAAGPWMVRAIILTGNPFAPLLNGLFPTLTSIAKP